MKVLYVPMPRRGKAMGQVVASDGLGFGVTCSDALVSGLRALGTEVSVVVSHAVRRTEWIGEVLTALEDAVRPKGCRGHDAVLAFHAFWPFTADVRRVLDDVGAVRLPLITYTHGSHWDETDRFRFERYPRLRWADLGNLLAADRILMVSRYLRDAITRNVHEVSRDAAEQVAERMRVVGLPLDLRRIDAAHVPQETGKPTIVFNHAPISAKQPGVFLDVAQRILRQTDASILMTRRLPRDSTWARRAAHLTTEYRGRFAYGDDMPIDDYFKALWQSTVQVSTATHESLGVATLEAMATGNQCLLPRIGSYPEITNDDPDVLYDDVKDFENRLLRAAKHPNQTVAERHQVHVRERYSPTAVGAAVRAVLDEAVAA